MERLRFVKATGSWLWLWAREASACRKRRLPQQARPKDSCITCETTRRSSTISGFGSPRRLPGSRHYWSEFNWKGAAAAQTSIGPAEGTQGGTQRNAVSKSGNQGQLLKLNLAGEIRSSL